VYLVSALDGQAMGVSLLDGVTGVLTRISDRATGSAVYTPNAEGYIAVRRTRAGNVIELESFTPGIQGQTLFGPSAYITTEGLTVIPQPELAPDVDGDGRPDAQDSCPGRAPLAGVEIQPLEEVPPLATGVRLHRLADTFAVNWRHGVERGLVRLSRRGESLKAIRVPSAWSAYSVNAGQWHTRPVWLGDHYDIPYFHGGGYRHRISRLGLTRDWQLVGDASPLYVGGGPAWTDANVNGFNIGYWSIQQTYDPERQALGYWVSGNAGPHGPQRRRSFRLDANGGFIDETANPLPPGIHCPQITRRERTFTRDDLQLLCGWSGGAALRIVNMTGDGLAVGLNQGMTDYAKGTFFATYGEQSGMVAYVDRTGRLHVRSISGDGDGRPTSVPQMVSGDLISVRGLSVAATDGTRNQFGVAFIASGGVYFVGLNADATPVSAPIRLSPDGAAIYGAPPQVAWTGDRWMVIWRDLAEGWVQAHGRFDCP